MRGPPAAGEAHRLQLLERLPHADEADAAAGGVDDDVRERALELLRQLVSHRLLAFDAVRLLQGRHLEPPVLRRVLRDEGAAVGDQAVDEVHVGAEGAALEDDRPRRVGRHRDHAPQAGLCRVGGGRASRIARGRQRDRVDPERLGHRDGGGEPARLERSRRVLPLVLDVEPVEAEVLSEAARLEERRHPFAECHGRRPRHHLLVAPHRRRTRGQRFTGERAARGGKVVPCQERPLALRTEVSRSRVIEDGAARWPGTLEMGER